MQQDKKLCISKYNLHAKDIIEIIMRKIEKHVPRRPNARVQWGDKGAISLAID